MHVIDFTQIDTVDGISKNFGFLPNLLKEIIHSKNQKKYYSVLKIPKKNHKQQSKYRTVYKAPEHLAMLHKNILLHLEKTITNIENNSSNKLIHQSVHGFTKKRGILTNAYAHLDKSNIIRVDIHSFFKTININDVFNVFLNLGLSRDGAELFSRLCTVDGVLEEGINTSPLISNLHCNKLDLAFSSLSKKYNATYTRYADDITISSDNHLPKLKSINKVLNDNGFSINRKKTRFCSKGRAQYVTGLSVSNNTRPRLPRLTKKRLRMEFFYIEKYGLISHLEKVGRDDDLDKELHKLEGWILFLNYIEPSLSKTYREILTSAYVQLTENLSKNKHG